jgi:hypothetical protein
MSKGSTPRPVNREQFDKNFDAIFGSAEKKRTKMAKSKKTASK